MNKVQLNSGYLRLSFVFIAFILSACSVVNVENSTATSPAPTITRTPVPISSITSSPTATAVFEGLGLTPELVKAIESHVGLESSLAKEADGRYTTTVTILNSSGESNTQNMDINPSTLSENISNKNYFGNTPTMMTTEGKKLYWIQEQKEWYLVEISHDIHNPTIIPFGKLEIATRVTITEFPDDFSQESLDWWKNTPGLEIGFQLLNVNANTGENTKFAYLRNQAMGLPDRTVANSPVQILDAWFAIDYPDGIRYEFFPTKWLDPSNPTNPKGGDWKIFFAASGPEIMNDEFNRNQFDKLLTQASTPTTHMEVAPIVMAQDGFFNGTNGLITFSAPQPSLAKLAETAYTSLGDLPLPNQRDEKYKKWLDEVFNMLTPTSQSFSFRFGSKTGSDYRTYFFPPEVQTILFPALVTLR